MNTINLAGLNYNRRFIVAAAATFLLAAVATQNAQAQAQCTTDADCSLSKGPCYAPGVCVPETGMCLYVPLNDGDSCTPVPADPNCLFYTCETEVCTKQCVVQQYTFTGFLPPVSDPPTLNGVQAGSAIPMQFSLDGDQGLNVIASEYPMAQQVTCAQLGSVVNMPPAVQTASPGSSTLAYDATSDQYTYVWKTDKKWAGTCQAFTLQLIDGSTHTSFFQF